MNQSKPEQLFKEADQFLESANNELQRPSQDVVTYSACQSTRLALYKFLNALAVIQSSDKNVILEPDLTLDQLITFCSQNSKEIRDIDFSSLQCSCVPVINDEDQEEQMVYCTSVKKVQYCAKLAKEVKEIATREMN